MNYLIIGQMVACNLTVLLYVKAIDKWLPHDYSADCKVISIERCDVDTLSPPHITVDCTKDLKWLDTNHRGKTELLSVEYTKEGCNE